MRFFGIDLGTSTCSVSYAVNSSRPNVIPQPKEVKFREEQHGRPTANSVPSVVVRGSSGDARQGETLYGFDAEARLTNNQAQARSYRDVFRSVKSHLGTDRSYVRALPSLNTPVKVWSGLIRHLCELTVTEKGADHDPRQHPTVLTVPASFGNAQREDTLQAAALAGFDVRKEANLVHLIDEPVAALIDYLNSPECDLHVDPERRNTVLVFDFGGGTCDLVALKFRYDASKPDGLDIQPQAISPYQQIGGDTIDLAIMEEVIWPQVCQQNGIKRDELTATEQRQIQDQLRYNVCRPLKERVNDIISSLPDEQFRRQDWTKLVEVKQLSGHCWLREKELQGWAELSANGLFELMLPFLDPDPYAAPFTIGEANRCLSFATLVQNTLERAGLTRDKLDLLVLHGGSCRSRFVRWSFERMKELGALASHCKIVSTPDPTTSVSRGAALFGCLSKKYGKPYVPPIAPEDMSIETIGKEFVPLIYAGDRLPYQKTFGKEFYLSSAGQREIAVPIHVGYDTDRRPSSTLKIEIEQKNLPQSHPVEVKLEIDVDKISHWRFRPKGYGWTAAYAVPNPWIGQEPSEDTQKLLETRKLIRTLIDENKQPPVRLMAAEAYESAIAGFPEEGLALIEDVIEDSQKTSSAWNTKGLIHGLRGDHRRALPCYEMASSLEPTNMVLRGNYGTALLGNKRYQEAIAVMREALSKEPSLTYLHAWLVDAFQALENMDEMNNELERWHCHAQRETIRQPEKVSAWVELRSTGLRLGRYEEAEEAAETIRQLRRTNNLLAGPSHG